MHLHFAKRIFALQSVRRLALLFPIVTASLAQAQYQDRYGQQSQTPMCHFRGGQYVCASAPMPDPYSRVPSPTLESLAREREEAQSRQVNQPRLLPMLQRYEPQPSAHPDSPDQSELLKNSKDPDFIRRHFRTMYIETRGIDLFGPELISAELKKNEEFNKMHIDIVQDRKVADTVLSVSYNFAWDYPFVLRHQNTTTVLLGGKGEGPFSGPLGAWDVAHQFVKAARKWRLEPEQKASTEQKTQADQKK